MSKILGYAPGELTSLSPEQTIALVHPEDQELFFGRFKDRLEGRPAPPDYEVRGIRKNGTVAWLELSSAKIEYNGQPAVQATFIDVTDRKKAEEELRESEERYRELFESIQDPVCIYVGKEGRLLDYNTAFKRFFGYSDEELKGKVFLGFVHPDDQAMVLQKYQTGYPVEEFPIVYEIRVMNKKEECFPLEISVSPYKRKGRVIGVEVVHRDITERKRYEENLSALNTHGRDLNMAKSVEEVYELTLDAAEKTLGFEFADVFMVKGKALRVVAHRGYFGNLSLELPLDGDKGITVRAARTGEPVLVQDISKDCAYVGIGLNMRSELAVPIKIGHRVFGVLNAEREKLNAFSEKDQELLEILASHAATAISNLNHANEVKAYTLEIEEAKTKFEGLFLGNPEAAVYLGPDLRIQDINPRFRELFGYSLDEVNGKHINDVVVPNGKMEEAQTLDGRAVEGYAHQNTVRRRKDGSLVPVSVSAAPITVKHKVIGYMAVYVDDTERKRYEENLSALNTHGRDLNMAKSVEEVYELTLDAMRKTLGFEYTRFMTIEKNNLMVACDRGHTRPVVPNLRIDGTRGITVRAIRTREPVFVQDVSKDGDYVAGLSGIQSELAVPVLAEDRVLGVLDVESRKLAAFSEKDVTLLQILASHAATAISNLLKRREIENRSGQMASLMKSSAEVIHTADLRRRLRTIAEAIREFGWRRVVISVRDENMEMRSPDDMVAVGITDEEREFLWKNRPPGHVVRERLGPEYERFKIGEFFYLPWNDPWVREKYGYKTSVLSHLKPEEMVDWHPQDTVYAPLRLADGRIVGRLSMDDPVDGRRPTKETLMPLELFLHQAAVAIENAQLIQELAHARTRAETYAREMRESQQKFERLFMDNPEAAVHLDSSFHILNVNPRFSRLFDYSLDEVKGRHINDVIVPKDKMGEAVAFDERASKGELYREDTIRKRKDGSLVAVAFSAAPIIVENQVKGHIAVYKDISQLKKSEDELREMLQKLDKMNEKLRVVGGLTRHDVRNKLSTITGNAYLLKKQLAGNSEVLDKLEDMEKAVQQTVRILDFARAYEMLGAEELVYTDVEKTVNEATSLFASRNNIEVINDCHGLIALADSLMRQLFYNLIDNSLKYGQKTSKIRVYYEKAGQGSLRLVYEDDGVGIPVADKPKLFKEGYSTGGSTGHGLYLIKRMMEAYGWTIQETGEPSKGARFVMTIPETNPNGKENYRVA
jgi:PAS domain S-box-containing protein